MISSKNLFFEDGLLEGLSHRLSSSQIHILASEFVYYYAEEQGVKVCSAGEKIKRSLEGEDIVSDDFKNIFQRRLKNILDMARNDNDNVVVNCCDHHKSQYWALRKAIKDKDNRWLSDLISVIAHSNNPDLIAQVPSKINDSGLLLSHFKRLDRFLFNNTNLNQSDNKQLIRQKKELARELLDPKLARGTRMKKLLKDEKIAPLEGYIGLYKDLTGAMTKRSSWCRRSKPFSTITEYIDDIYGQSNFRFNKTPDKALLNLGKTFDGDVSYIELQFKIDKAEIPYEKLHRVGIPTAVDATGHWAFQPSREGKRHGYAKNIMDDSNGLPEVLFDPFDPHRLYDAIIWSNNTGHKWSKYSCIG